MLSKTLLVVLGNIVSFAACIEYDDTVHASWQHCHNLFRWPASYIFGPWYLGTAVSFWVCTSCEDEHDLLTEVLHRVVSQFLREEPP